MTKQVLQENEKVATQKKKLVVQKTCCTIKILKQFLESTRYAIN